MSPSNFDELRRVRESMSAAAGHNVRTFAAQLAAYRDRYRQRLQQPAASPPPVVLTLETISTPDASAPSP